MRPELFLSSRSATNKKRGHSSIQRICYGAVQKLRLGITSRNLASNCITVVSDRRECSHDKLNIGRMSWNHHRLPASASVALHILLVKINMSAGSCWVEGGRTFCSIYIGRIDLTCGIHEWCRATTSFRVRQGFLLRSAPGSSDRLVPRGPVRFFFPAGGFGLRVPVEGKSYLYFINCKHSSHCGQRMVFAIYPGKDGSYNSYAAFQGKCVEHRQTVGVQRYELLRQARQHTFDLNLGPHSAQRPSLSTNPT